MEDTPDIFRTSQALVKERFHKNPPYYQIYLTHTERVKSYVEQLIANGEVDVDQDVVRLAAIFHDISRPDQDLKLISEKHAVHGAKVAQQILLANNYPKAKEVYLACVSHGKAEDAQTEEAKVLYDAHQLSTTSLENLVTWVSGVAAGEITPDELIKKWRKELGETNASLFFKYSRKVFDKRRTCLEDILRSLEDKAIAFSEVKAE